MMSALAQLLDGARDTGRPVLAATAREHDLDVAAAYRLQSSAVRARQDRGARQVGYKVALTAAAAQESLATTEPALGRLLSDMRVPAGTSLADLGPCAPLVEAELVFRIGTELAGPDCTAGMVRTATEAVVPALEIADCRVADWDVSAGLFVADNSAAGWFMLCDDTTVGVESARDVEVRVAANGTESATGRGRNLMGDPAQAVAWLVNKLHEFGLGLQPGDLVLSGALAPPVPLRSGDSVRAEFSAGCALEVSW